MPAPHVARRTGTPAAYLLTLQALCIDFDAQAQASCKIVVKQAASKQRGLGGQLW